MAGAEFARLVKSKKQSKPAASLTACRPILSDVTWTAPYKWICHHHHHHQGIYCRVFVIKLYRVWITKSCSLAVTEWTTMPTVYRPTTSRLVLSWDFVGISPRRTRHRIRNARSRWEHESSTKSRWTPVRPSDTCDDGAGAHRSVAAGGPSVGIPRRPSDASRRDSIDQVLRRCRPAGRRTAMQPAAAELLRPHFCRGFFISSKI